MQTVRYSASDQTLIQKPLRNSTDHHHVQILDHKVFMIGDLNNRISLKNAPEYPIFGFVTFSRFSLSEANQIHFKDNLTKLSLKCILSNKKKQSSKSDSGILSYSSICRAHT